MLKDSIAEKLDSAAVFYFLPRGVYASHKISLSTEMCLRKGLYSIGMQFISVTTREPGDEIRMRVTNERMNGKVRCEFPAHHASLPEKSDRAIDGTSQYRKAYMQFEAKGHKQASSVWTLPDTIS